MAADLSPAKTADPLSHPGPSPGVAERVARLRRTQPIRWTPVRGGYTQAERWVAWFKDGSSAFAKAATDDRTALFLRREMRIYG